MGRGPGEKRRFSGKSFVLSETYRQGSLADTLNYEQRNKEVSFRAKVLRQSGFNARIVNGSGWTAIYVAVPDLQPMKKLPKPAKIAPPIPKAEIKPIPPQIKPIIWVIFLLVYLAKTGRAKATRAATPLYTAKQTLTQSAPSLYAAEAVSEEP